jgi:hypothetical protein
MATYFVKSNGVTVDVCDTKGAAISVYVGVKAPKQLVEIKGVSHRVILNQLWQKPVLYARHCFN